LLTCFFALHLFYLIDEFYMKKIFFIALILGAFVACKKSGSPEAKICVSKEIYKTTDTIQLVNCSLRSSKQRWVLPNGVRSMDKTIYYVPNGAGSYSFTIYVSDDDFVNEYTTTQIVVVK
jgi:hypothetical protein